MDTLVGMGPLTLRRIYFLVVVFGRQRDGIQVISNTSSVLKDLKPSRISSISASSARGPTLAYLKSSPSRSALLQVISNSPSEKVGMLCSHTASIRADHVSPSMMYLPRGDWWGAWDTMLGLVKTLAPLVALSMNDAFTRWYVGGCRVLDGSRCFTRHFSAWRRCPGSLARARGEWWEVLRLHALPLGSSDARHV